MNQLHPTLQITLAIFLLVLVVTLAIYKPGAALLLTLAIYSLHYLYTELKG